MSLTKLFNFKFMKQMLKKAKGQLIIFLCLVPIFTFLSLLVSFSGENVGVLDYGDLCIINLLGSYVVPIILSINLFNYIYKRPSVDFINSMPINKKTIFLSNTLLGIILIVLMQVINAFGIFAFSLLKPEIVLFSRMVWDIFLVATMTYIFVFTATNLAMCISGNIITQIAVTCLIVFFVPFFVNNFNDNFFDVRTGSYFIANDGIAINGNESVELVELDAYNETMPYRLIKCVFSSGISVYNGVSILKMFILSVVYSVLGALLFKKRKFENLGESFTKIKTHEFVKALTMFPMFAILNKLEILESDIEIILLVYAILIAYFIIYDIITAKKIKLKITLLSIIIVFVVLNVITIGIEKIIDKKEAVMYTIDDVKSISVDLSGYREYYSDILDYEITDRSIIEKVLKNNYSFVSTTKVRMNDGKEFIADRIYTSIDNPSFSREELLEVLLQDENYKNKLIESKLKDGYYTLYNDVKITGEFEKEIKEYIEEYQKNNVNEDENVSDSIFDIEKYYYENHEIKKEIYSIKDTNIKEKIVEIYNSNTKKNLKNIEEDDYLWFEIRNESLNRTISAGNKFLSEQTIKDLILNDNEKIDFNKEVIVVRLYQNYRREDYFITNNELLRSLYYKELNRMEYEDNYYYYKDKEVMLEQAENVDIQTNTIENTVVNVVD